MRELRSSGSVGGVVRPSGRAALSRKQPATAKDALTYNSPHGNNTFTTASLVVIQLTGDDSSYRLVNSIGSTKKVSAKGGELENR